ncbi:uncharacterized protein FIBRA_04958 [Fibroporia radiculosa]|uniref:Uncharacterized protein n=1 Tax=Fibroporia radiculosa TaxID=599839 RepID=J4IAG0_9APHY|nr:uncharacterized protein FIBRA_04958 [Fibroporia radiculosa]CCM02846.1 predicted protein [Fibroporia radiculosa]
MYLLPYDLYTSPVSRRQCRRRLSDVPVLRSSDPCPSRACSRFESHQDLLNRFSSNIAEEERRLQTLLLAHDLDGSRYSGLTAGALQACSQPAESCAYQHGADVSDPLSSDGIRDKYDYLLTPLRMKYFPKLSPDELRTLLSTPPTRVATPDCSWWADSPTGMEIHSPSHSRREKVCLRESMTLCRTGTGRSSSSLAPVSVTGGCSCPPLCGRASHGGDGGGGGATLSLPLTPPLSTQFPVLGAFASHDDDVVPAISGSSGEVRAQHTRARARTPLLGPFDSLEDGSVHALGSGSGSDSDPAPCSISAASTAGVPVPVPLPPSADEPRGSRDYAAARDARDPQAALQNDPALTRGVASLTTVLQRHGHGPLTSDAVLGFRRVIDELQGAEERPPRDRSSSQIDSPSPPCQESAGHAARTASRDPPDSAWKARTREQSPGLKLDRGELPLSGPFASTRITNGKTSSLSEEYHQLLHARAEEEERLAAQLTLLAHRLETMANCRRQLARIARATE